MDSRIAPPSNGFVAVARKIYHPLGFSKGYNFTLFFIFAGAMLGFSLARVQFFDFHGNMCGEGGDGGTLPGECFWYKKSLPSQIGIRMHLLGVLPAGILVVFQFMPAVRRRWILFHRVNGYVIILLILAGTAGAFMIARHAVGGGLDIQGATGFLGIVVLVELGLAWWNIKKLQIDQHRAWMLRAWVVLGTPITTRIILIIAAQVISKQGGYSQPRLCEQVEFLIESAAQTLELYPECASYFNGNDTGKHVLVAANINSERVEEISVALGAPFGMSLWLAMVIHIAAVEIYLQLTPRESSRLRQISYQRQLEAGLTPPGSAGLVAERLGDAEAFIPATDLKSSNGKLEEHDHEERQLSHESIQNN